MGGADNGDCGAVEKAENQETCQFGGGATAYSQSACDASFFSDADDKGFFNSPTVPNTLMFSFAGDMKTTLKDAVDGARGSAVSTLRTLHFKEAVSRILQALSKNNVGE